LSTALNGIGENLAEKIRSYWAGSHSIFVGPGTDREPARRNAMYFSVTVIPGRCCAVQCGRRGVQRRVTDRGGHDEGPVVAPGGRPGGRTGLEGRLDGGGDELGGLGVDGDVAAEQHAADDVAHVPGRVLRTVTCHCADSALIIGRSDYVHQAGTLRSVVNHQQGNGAVPQISPGAAKATLATLAGQGHFDTADPRDNLYAISGPGAQTGEQLGSVHRMPEEIGIASPYRAGGQFRQNLPVGQQVPREVTAAAPRRPERGAGRPQRARVTSRDATPRAEIFLSRHSKPT
jgi:hypothetical protein